MAVSIAIDIIIRYVFPIIGGLLGFILCISPLKALKEVEKSGELGALNPVPACVFLCNSITWVIFAAAIHNPFVFFANASAAPVNLHIILRCYPYADKKLRHQMERILLGSSFLLLAIGTVYLFVDRIETAIHINGSVAMITNMLLYASPLSTLGLVIKSRSSASIYLPWTLAAQGCSFTWLVYGLVLKQMPIIAPNVVGLVLSMLQLSLRIMLPIRPSGVDNEKESQKQEENEREMQKKQPPKERDIEEGNQRKQEVDKKSIQQHLVPPQLVIVKHHSSSQHQQQHQLQQLHPVKEEEGKRLPEEPESLPDLHSRPTSPPPPYGLHYCSTSVMTAPMTPMSSSGLSCLSLYSEFSSVDIEEEIPGREEEEEGEEPERVDVGCYYCGDLEAVTEEGEGVNIPQC